MSKRAWFWTLGVVFAGHNAEEWIGAPLLLQQMQSRAPAFVRDFYADVQVADLRRYTIEGGGHTWPGGGEAPEWFVGRIAHTVDASSIMWEFYKEHPLRR